MKAYLVLLVVLVLREAVLDTCAVHATVLQAKHAAEVAKRAAQVQDSTASAAAAAAAKAAAQQAARQEEAQLTAKIQVRPSEAESVTQLAKP